MTIMEERTALAVKRHAGLKLRAIGIPDADTFEPHTLSWSDLNKRQRSVADLSRSLLDGMADNADETTVRGLSDAHEGLMALYDLITSEKDHRTALGSRDARSHGGNPMRPIPGDAECHGDGFTVLRHSDDEPIAHALKPEQRMAEWARKNTTQRHEEISPGAYLRAMVLGGKNEAEKRALSEGTDSAGGYTVPDVLSAQLIDRLRASSVLIRAGARTIPLTSDQNYIAKIATDPVPAWRAEAASIAESDPTFARVSLAPKSLAVLVKVSREVLEDSLNIEAALVLALTQAMALEVDRAGMFGSGSGAEPQGLANMVGIGEVALDAALATYAPLIAARTQVLTANAGDPTAYIMHPREDGTLVGLTATDGQPLQAPAKIAAIPQLVTTSVPINGGTGTNEGSIITGNFTRFMIGLRNGLRIEMLKERYADTHQYAFVAHLRATFAVEHVGAFSHVTGVQPAA